MEQGPTQEQLQGTGVFGSGGTSSKVGCCLPLYLKMAKLVEKVLSSLQTSAHLSMTSLLEHADGSFS